MLRNQNQPTVNDPSDDKSRFQNYGVKERAEKRREFHSPEAQRKRNEERREKRVRERAVGYNRPNNSENTDRSNNDSQGNDSTSANQGTGIVGGSGGGGNDDGFELLDFDVVEGNEAVLYQWRAAAVTP